MTWPPELVRSPGLPTDFTASSHKRMHANAPTVQFDWQMFAYKGTKGVVAEPSVGNCCHDREKRQRRSDDVPRRTWREQELLVGAVTDWRLLSSCTWLWFNIRMVSFKPDRIQAVTVLANHSLGNNSYNSKFLENTHRLDDVNTKSASYQDHVDTLTLPPLLTLTNDPSDPNPDSLVAVGDIKRLTAVAHFTAIINTPHVPEFEAVNVKWEGKKEKWGSWVAAVQGHWSWLHLVAI